MIEPCEACDGVGSMETRRCPVCLGEGIISHPVAPGDGDQLQKKDNRLLSRVLSRVTKRGHLGGRPR